MTPLTLPVEIWQQILDECVSLPTFLDPDLLSEVNDPLYDLFSHTDYKATGERHRKNLQTVCKWWYIYLAKFEHRFVSLMDIAHMRVPKDAVFKAIRIDCGLCGPRCEYCFPGGSKFMISTLLDSIGSQTSAARLPVEIIGGPLDDEMETVAGTLIDVYQYMPRLKIILNAALSVSGRASALKNPLDSFRNLQFLFIITHFEQSPWPKISAPNLTTLSYYHEIQPFILPLNQWNLPALNDLRFPLWSHIAAQHIDELTPLLEAVGSNLRSLQVGRLGISDAVLPERLWDLCPRLERLDSTLYLHYPPPKFHPLHTISLFFPESYRFGTTVLPLANSTLNWPSLRRVILQSSWKRFDEVDSLEEELPDIIEWLEEFVATCERHGVTLEDSDGLPFKGSRLASLL